MIKRVRNRKFVYLILVLSVFLSAGCKKKPVNVPPPAKEKSQAVKPVPPVQNQLSSSQIKSEVSPQTALDNIKDPFKPYVLETKPVAPLFSGQNLLPIQSYDVGQFRVLGIITGLKQNSALVVDPTGKAYVVKAGMEIGKNGGRVEKINAKSIEVTEKYRDENGKIKTRTVRLALPRKE